MRIKRIWAGVVVLFLSSISFAMLLFAISSVPVSLQTPADGDSTYMIHPHFKWSEDPDADRYEIQIAQDETFQTMEDTDSVPVSRYVPLDALPAGTCWWRVRARYRDGSHGRWTDSRQLTISVPQNLYTVSVGDSTDVITNTIAAAAADTPARLVFETGTYRVPVPDGRWLFQLEDVHDLIVDGQDSLIIMDNPDSGFCRLESCADILLRNFQVDYFNTNGIPTTHTAGTVISTDAATASFVFQPLENYLPPDDPIIRDASARRWGCLMDTNTPGRLKVNVPNWFDFKDQVDALGNNLYRLYLIDAHAGRISDFQPGDTFVKSGTYGEFVMFCQFCTNVTYEAITSYAGAANHYIGNWNDGIHFLRCASRIKKGRLMSNSNGGYVGSGYLTGFWIEECLTEGMFDDAVNCNNGPSDVLDKPASNQVLIWGFSARYLEAGDAVTVYTAPEGLFNGRFTVNELEFLLGGKDDGGGWLLTLDRDVGTIDPGLENWNSKVYIDKLAHTDAYIRNSTFQNSRRFGCLFKSYGGVIEGNHFEGLSEAAVHAENESRSFDGGLECRDVRVLNNTIVDCGYSDAFFYQGHGAIEFGISAYNTVCTQAVHRSVEISGNTICDWDGMGISIENAEDVLICSNTVSNLSADEFFATVDQNHAVSLAYTAGATVTGNHLLDTRPMDAAVYVENSSNCIVLYNDMASTDVYSSDFSDVSSLTGTAYNVTVDGFGHLVSTSSAVPNANYRFSLPGGPLTADPSVTEIRWKAVLRVPTNSEWVAIGLLGGDAALLSSGSDSGPWVLFRSTFVNIWGGHSTSVSSDTFRNLFSPGDVITAEFAYHVLSKTVDLYIDGDPVAVELPIVHKDEDGNEADPVVGYAQLLFRLQDPGAAYFDQFEIRSLPVEVH
ncbi:right-handed parallel beta-helix repeat-containing protein [Tichowtungia aerotolerans]|uniref:Right handed beta helix domain-containing protein n=1 Tax=Tichowtungia aerotolerans TaxID=2697043 RepID=A0A6P1MDZ5_9BACT|nr:right-handed parallel beta-helix repeat-containing protein [Tichowtungia aerotolerans]QHI69816.1 hypothetical protein GT409_10265 [Tichowtungia aerotolerans]